MWVYEASYCYNAGGLFSSSIDPVKISLFNLLKKMFVCLFTKISVDFDHVLHFFSTCLCDTRDYINYISY